MFNYIEYIYNFIKDYFYPENHLYNIPFNVTITDQNDGFKMFKNSNNETNKVIFALNNMPDVVYSLLFNNSGAYDKLFTITLKIKNKKIVDFQHNLDVALPNFKYIFIRVNVIELENVIQHVNCIILNTQMKYVLFFDSKIEFSYDVNHFLSLFFDIVNFEHPYDLIFPENLGYNNYNKLQMYDAFCQTYIFLVFMLIMANENVNIKDFSKMFNSIITNTNLGYFLFHISELLKINKIEIANQEGIWSFPTNKTHNLYGMFNLFFMPKEIHDISTLQIKQDDDFIIVDHLT